MNWETVYILCKKYTDTVASGDVDIYLEHATIENGHLKLEMSDGTVFDVGNVGVIDDNVSSADYAYSSAKVDELVANVNAALAENNENIQQEITDRTNAINELRGSISSINTNIDTVEGNISTIQSTLGTVQTNITTLQTDKADAADVYTKSETDTRLAQKADASAVTSIETDIDELQADVVSAQADITALQTDKADKPVITSVSAASPSVTLTDNTEARCGAVTLLTLTLPSSTGDDYISAVIFTANSNTPLSYPDTIVMVGTDCIDGVFAPVSGKRYEVIVTNDGASYVGRVSGYEVSA